MLIVRNEAHCLGQCLKSIASIVDEIIVLDSGSNDDTVAIARSFGANVEIVDWVGYGPQRNRALARARCEWVLSIDADERVSPQLAASIRDAVHSPRTEVNGWFIPFLATWCGKPVRFGDWAGKQHLRMFRRTRGRFTNALIHERVLCPPPYGTLGGLMLHDTIASVEEALEKTMRYAELSAQREAAEGRGGFWTALAHCSWTFTRGYLLKGGFLDGVVGWRVAKATACGSWLRYRLAGQKLLAQHHSTVDNS